MKIYRVHKSGNALSCRVMTRLLKEVPMFRKCFVQWIFTGLLMAFVGACASAMRAPVAQVSPEGGELVSQTLEADFGSNIDIPFMLTQIPERPAKLELIFGVADIASG